MRQYWALSILLIAAEHNEKAVQAPFVEATGSRRAMKTASKPFLGDGSAVYAEFPKDRCKAGYVTFGPVDGKYFKCEALGRGITRWTSENPALSRDRSQSTVVYNGSRRTQVNDWIAGRTSDGKKCWVYSAHLNGGMTPETTFTLAGRSDSGHSEWSYYKEEKGRRVYVSYGVKLNDGVNGRGAFRFHSDNRFGSYPNIEDLTHSTAGCIKLRPECMMVFQDFAEKHPGMQVIVR